MLFRPFFSLAFCFLLVDRAFLSGLSCVHLLQLSRWEKQLVRVGSVTYACANDYSHSPPKLSLHISHNTILVIAMGYACKFYGCSPALLNPHLHEHVCMNVSRGFPGPSVTLSSLFLANPHNYCGSIFAPDSLPHPPFPIAISSSHDS